MPNIVEPINSNLLIMSGVELIEHINLNQLEIKMTNKYDEFLTLLEVDDIISTNHSYSTQWKIINSWLSFFSRKGVPWILTIDKKSKRRSNIKIWKELVSCDSQRREINTNYKLRQKERSL